jgi:hypothetical protein
MTATMDRTDQAARVNALKQEAKILDGQLFAQRGLQPMASGIASTFPAYGDAMSRKVRATIRREEIEAELASIALADLRAELTQTEAELADRGDDLEARMTRTAQRAQELAAEAAAAQFEAMCAKDEWERLIGRRSRLVAKVAREEARIQAARTEQARQRQFDPANTAA